MIKVSVIVPVYNVEKYLKKCIDSIIKQTLTDMEIICVDDGSTDSCPEILDEYANLDHRIKVIHKTNAGYGHAVNTGFAYAKGEYIGIVESDDYILPEMYETLYYCARQYDLDAVKSDYFMFWGDIVIRKPKSDILYNQLLGPSDKMAFFECPIANWSGLYKREFLVKNHIKHNETPGASYQDIGFWIQSMSMTERIMWIDKAFYMYRQDNPSQSIKNRTKMIKIREEFQFAESILLERGLWKELDYMNAFRIRMYKFAFYNRIGIDLKRSFAKIIIQDYLKYKKFEYAKDVIISDSLQKWYDKLIQNTELVCDDAAHKMHFWDDVDKIILFGAGQVAERAYIWLRDRGFIGRLRYIAVSKKNGIDLFKSHEIKEISELIEYKDDLVVVAVKKDSQIYNEILETLDQLCFKNYIAYTDFNEKLQEDCTVIQ